MKALNNGKKIRPVKIPSTPENRLLFRETLFSASGMSECIGGVIYMMKQLNKNLKKNKIPELISKMGSAQVLKLILVPKL